MLHEWIAINHDEIVRRCKAKVAMRSVPPPTDVDLDHGVPVFLDQLVDALRLGRTSTPEIARTASAHGHDLLLRGFTVSQVVHDYGDVCQTVTELAVEQHTSVSTEDFRTLNGCLDDAIAGAVTQYGRERNQSGIDRESARGTERLGFLVHELRNLIHSALLGFEVLKTTNAGVAGSAGAVLQRSLLGLSALVSRSLAEVRLTQGVQHRELVLVSALLEELAPAATLEAAARGIRLVVVPIEEEFMVEADRPVLAAVVTNLLQNAVKFTKPHTTITLRASTREGRALIEVQDECGGLPDGDVDDLFRAFEQRGADRTGLGLGLAFSRWAVEANDGRIHARSLPGTGCVFTIDLPLLPVAATVHSG